MEVRERGERTRGERARGRGRAMSVEEEREVIAQVGRTEEGRSVDQEGR